MHALRSLRELASFAREFPQITDTSYGTQSSSCQDIPPWVQDNSTQVSVSVLGNPVQSELSIAIVARMPPRCRPWPWRRCRPRRYGRSCRSCSSCCRCSRCRRCRCRCAVWRGCRCRRWRECGRCRRSRCRSECGRCRRRAAWTAAVAATLDLSQELEGLSYQASYTPDLSRAVEPSLVSLTIGQYQVRR